MEETRWRGQKAWQQKGERREGQKESNHAAKEGHNGAGRKERERLRMKLSRREEEKDE